MKLLHVINSLGFGGAEKLILDSIPSYEKEFNVDLLLLNGKETLHLKKLEKKIKGKIYKLGYKSIYNPVYIFRIIPFLRKYDIIHVHLFPSLYFVAIAKILSFSKVRLIYTEHSTHNRRRNHILFKVLDKIIYKKYHVICCISNQVRNNLKGYLNIKELPIITINNGVKLSDFRNVKKTIGNIPTIDNRKVITQVSRFSIQKDQKTLIKSISLLPENYILFLVGEGELLEECKSLVDELNLKKRIYFLGLRDDIPSIMNISDIIVQSSIWEGFGLTAVEGMASGKPVVVSNVNGLKDIVQGYGVVFEKGDSVSLSQVIKNILEDESEYKLRSKLCLIRSEEYSIEKMVSKYIMLYNNK